jgi:hypothetical protein
VKKQDVVDWKQHPVTVEFFMELKSRIEGLKEEIVGGVLSESPELLTFKAGAIQAFRDIQEIDFIEESHGN